MSVVMPAMRESQRAGWHALLDVYDAHPTGWTLVGGQMVHLWCAERGVSPTRPTDDMDTVLDVRGEPGNPGVLMTFTSVLGRLGFEPTGTSPSGHQHRWVKADARSTCSFRDTWANAPRAARGHAAAPRSRRPVRSRRWTARRISR